MKDGIGAKGGKKDHKLTLLNIFRNKKKLLKETKEQIEKKHQAKIKKEKNEIQLPEKIESKQVELKSKEIKPPEPIIEEEIISINSTHKAKAKTPEIKPKATISAEKKLAPTNEIENIKPKAVNKEIVNNQDNIIKSPQQEENTKKKKKKNTYYLEQEIIHILEETIKENNYELKKLDSDIYTIKQTIDSTEEEDINELEDEIDDIITRFNTIQNQLKKLKKSFNLDFPIDNADNYLIYLIDEYKNNLRSKKELSDKLEKNEKYQDILTRIVELELKKDELIEKTEERKKKIDIDNKTLDKMNDNIINIENKAKEIKVLVDNGTKELENIKTKVQETVHITERFETITKSVKHSIFELLQLMHLFKHHLSLKNNAVNAIAANVTLDLIMKMCTPIEERVLVKESDVKDYENMINDCINNTNKLLDTIKNNLNHISSIRYIFENDYKELSQLPMYKEITDKLNQLESDMKERLDSTKKLTKEMNLELEKNNSKVKKYRNLEVA